jgi:hypothetical protein
LGGGKEAEVATYCAGFAEGGGGGYGGEEGDGVEVVGEGGIFGGLDEVISQA